MGRQTFSDGPAADPPLASVGSYTTTTIASMWPSAQFTPIFAGDPKVGKIYSVRAGGIFTTSNALCTMIITPRYNTATPVTLTAGPAQLLPLMTSIPWFLQAELVFRTIGAPGVNSTCIMTGAVMTQGTIATAGAGTVIPFGGVSATVDASIASSLDFQTTLGGTTGSPVIQTLWAYIFSRN
jgi:hypothetical protein